VEADEQRDALETVLSTLTPEFLAIDPEILKMLPPSAHRYATGEAFPGRTQLLFDPLGAAEAAASLTLEILLHPARMARLVAYGSLGDYPNLEEVVDRLLEVTWGAPAQRSDYLTQIMHVAQRVTINEMMSQAASDENSGEVRAVLSHRLGRLATDLEDIRTPSAHQATAAADIRRWQADPEGNVPVEALTMPPGDPI
jgi:hypothetical protein